MTYVRIVTASGTKKPQYLKKASAFIILMAKLEKAISEELSDLEPVIEESLRKHIGVSITELNRDITEKLKKNPLLGFSIRYDLPFKEAKLEFKKEYLKKLLLTNHGNISHVAELAGIDRRSVHRIISKTKLDVHILKDELLPEDYIKRVTVGEVLHSAFESYGKFIHPERLEQAYSGLKNISEDISREIPEVILPMEEAIKEFEKLYFTEHLQRNKHNISRTARAVKIRFETLHKKLKALGMIV